MMKRIILHWTAGADGVNETESDSYNFIVGRDGSVTNGSHPPEAQVPPLKYGHYAAHTLNCNSYSIWKVNAPPEDLFLWWFIF